MIGLAKSLSRGETGEMDVRFGLYGAVLMTLVVSALNMLWGG